MFLVLMLLFLVAAAAGSLGLFVSGLFWLAILGFTVALIALVWAGIDARHRQSRAGGGHTQHRSVGTSNG